MWSWNHKRIILLLIIVLKFDIHYENGFIRNNMNYISDKEECPICFKQSMNKMIEYLDRHIEIVNNDISKILNRLFSDKRLQFGLLHGHKIIVKQLNSKNQMRNLRMKVCAKLDLAENCEPFTHEFIDGRNAELVQSLKEIFLDRDKVEGSHLCPDSEASLTRFLLAADSKESDSLYNLILINIDMQPLILKLFASEAAVRVPKFIALHGLSLIETDKGISLYKYAKSPFKMRKRLAKDLLQCALFFTKGTDGFRFYFTDITMDNVVVDPKTLQISLVDLDNAIILDTLATEGTHADKWPKNHTYEEIPCPGCFAYSIDDICVHSLSDINIYSVCQLLYADLFQDPTQGFLYTDREEERNDEINTLLVACVHCKYGACNRFDIASKLISIL